MPKKTKKVYKADPEKLLGLSDETLDEDIRLFPLDYYYLQNARNKANTALKEKTFEKEKLKAEIFSAEKSSVAYDRPPSDKTVEAIVREDSDYLTIKQEIIELDAKHARLDSMVKAMEVKAKLLQTISSNNRANS